MDGHLGINSLSLQVLVLKRFEVPVWKESGRGKAGREYSLKKVDTVPLQRWPLDKDGGRAGSSLFSVWPRGLY
jgi:hypothetical protein